MYFSDLLGGATLYPVDEYLPPSAVGKAILFTILMAAVVVVVVMVEVVIVVYFHKFSYVELFMLNVKTFLGQESALCKTVIPFFINSIGESEGLRVLLVIPLSCFGN